MAPGGAVLMGPGGAVLMATEPARVLLFTGKGGVGKTTTAAATALQLASQGLRVVLTSADPAHSLTDILAVPLGTGPREVTGGLWAQELNALERMEESWGDVRSWLVELFDWAGLSALEAEELAVLPGLEELVALMEIGDLAGDGDYDVVVVDCAPTAETIRLLSLPDLLDWYFRRAFAASRKVTRLVAPILTRVSDVPVASPAVFDALEGLHGQLSDVRRLLTDESVTSARIVATAESVVLAEARRTFTYLSMFGYHTDAVILNRLVPGDSEDPFLVAMASSQAEHVESARAEFAPLTMLRSEHAATEIKGLDALSAHGAQLWQEVDPVANLCPGAAMSVRFEDGRPVLVLSLPHVEGHEVDLCAIDGDLSIAVGPYRRNLALPSALRGRGVSRAELDRGELCIEFEGTAPSEDDAS